MIFLLLSLTVATLNWTGPVETVSGEPLPRCIDVTDETVIRCLDAFRIYHGTFPRVYDQPVIEVDETVLGMVVAPPTAERYYFAVTALDRAGNESAFSGEVSKLITDDAPLAPIILPQEEEVFTVKMQPDLFLLFNVGTVPAGTVCDLNSGAPRGYGVVPNAAVVWTSATGPRPIAVVTKCDG